MSDLTDRKQALKDYQDKLCEAVSCVDCPFCIDRLYGGCKVEKYLINLPSAEKTGRWSRRGRWKGAGMGDYMYSLCAELVSGNRYHYCPNCGARMVNDESTD